MVNPKLEDKTCKLIIVPVNYSESNILEVTHDNVKIVEIYAKLIQMGIRNDIYTGAWSSGYFTQNNVITKTAKVYDLDMAVDNRYAGYYDSITN